MSKYDSLDSKIMGKLSRSRPCTFSTIFIGDVGVECKEIAFTEVPQKEPFRILDRRLQALRKAGKIVSTTKGWILCSRGGAA